MNNSIIPTVKKHGVIVLVFLAFSLLPFVWLQNKQLLIGYDAVYPLDPLSFLNDKIYSWTETQNFGMDRSGIQGSLLIHFLDSIPQFFHANAQLSQKLVYSFWFFLMLLSPYIFILRLEKYKIIKLPAVKYIFPILYAFNFYILQAWWVAERTKLSIVIVTPLILSLLFPIIISNSTKKKVIRNAFISSLLLFLLNGGGWGGFPLYGGLFVSLLFFYFFFIIYFIHKKKFEKIILIHLFYVVFGITFFLLDSYTLLPFIAVTFRSYKRIVNATGGITGLISWAEYLSKDTSFLNLFRLQGIPEWYNMGRFHPYAVPYLSNKVLIFFSYLFSLALLLSFKITHKNKNPIILFLQFLFLISLFFTAGIHAPFGFLYKFLMGYVPGFSVFRSPIFKFGYLYWLLAGLFISIFISYSIEWMEIKVVAKYKRLFFFVAIFFVNLLILLYHYPYFISNIFHVSKYQYTSRVTVPQYVFEFASWWKTIGNGEKILMLPKLNNGSFFEIYSWNYLSLTPILSNFARSGIVENSDQLTEKEQKLVAQLYEAINTSDYTTEILLAKQLGIGYLAVRKDFDYNNPEYSTDDPAKINQLLLQDHSVSHVKTFGKWVVYKFSRQNPLFYTSGNAAIYSGDIPDSANLPLSIQDGLQYIKKENISSDVVFPECLTCKAEKTNIKVNYPEPKILPGTFLYELLQLKNLLHRQKTPETIDEKIGNFIGKTVTEAGQLHQFVAFRKYSDGIDMAFANYIHDLTEIYSLISTIDQQSQNPYSTTLMINQYMQSEGQFLQSFMLQDQNNMTLKIKLDALLMKINEIISKTQKYYSLTDFNAKNIYRFAITVPGDYEFKLKASTLGRLSDFDSENIFLIIDNKQRLSVQSVGEYLSFGYLPLSSGNHRLTLLLPPQKNLLTNSVEKTVVGNNCFTSSIQNFSKEKFYLLHFLASNNSEKLFYFFVNGKKSYETSLLTFFPSLNAHPENDNFILSQENESLDTNSTTTNVYFCSPNFTSNTFTDNIEELSVFELVHPEISAGRKISITFTQAPQIIFKEINPTQFKITVAHAQNPYYLLFTERFDPQWVASTGIHIEGNGYENVWYVPDVHIHSIDIKYIPQRDFSIGVGITAVTLLAVFIIFFIKKI